MENKTETINVQGGYGHSWIKLKKLNFGCGTDTKENFDNLDLKDFDFNVFPYPIKDNTYDYIYSNHVLEHLKDIDKVFDELWRISKDNAIIEIYVPHFNCEGAFSELGHISYFTENTFKCLAEPRDWRNTKARFEIIELKSVPTYFGLFLPFRRKLSLIFRGIYQEIYFKVRVMKNA